MKKVLLVAVLAIIFSESFCRDPFTDSLRHELANAKGNSARLNTLQFMTNIYAARQPDSALYYGYQAIGLSQKLGNKKEEAQLFFDISRSYAAMGNSIKATEMDLKGLVVAEEIGDIHMQANILNTLGVYHKDAKEYNQSLQYFRRAMALYEAQGKTDAVFSALCLNQIAGIYLQRGQLDSAKYYNTMAMERWNNIALTDPGNKAFRNNRFIKTQILYILAGIESYKKNYLTAKQFLKESLLNADAFGVPDDVKSNYELARVFITTNQPDSAAIYAKQSLVIAQKLNQYSGIAEAGNLLAAIYKQKDPQQAIFYQQKVIAAYDSAVTRMNNNSIRNLVLFDDQQRQRDIEAATTNYQNKVRQYALLSGMSVLLLIGFILYRNNQRKQKSNKILQQTLTNLKSTQAQLIHSEKMASLGELTAGIAHEIQNPLNFVNNFSEVNKEMIVEMKEEIDKGNYDEAKLIANDIEENQEKINHHGKRADAIVKGMLQHSKASTGVKEPTDINKMTDEYLRLAYHGFRAKDKEFNVEITTDFGQSIGNMNVIQQDIGRVLLNLFNNAFYAVNEKKKASDENYQPSVLVQTKKLNNKVEIIVRDNGNGVSQNIVDKIFQPFFTTKPTGQGTGLGLSLTYDIIKAHGGEIKVESKEGEGSKFFIHLPVA